MRRLETYARQRPVDLAFALLLTGMLVVALYATRHARIVSDSNAELLTSTLASTPGHATVTLDTYVFGSGELNHFAQTPHPTISMQEENADLSVGGWATDDSARAAAAGLIAQIDGEDRVAATYGAPRADVATALGEPDATNSGFTVRIPARLLTPGRHAVSFLVVARDKRGFYFVPDRFFVDVSP